MCVPECIIDWIFQIGFLKKFKIKQKNSFMEASSLRLASLAYHIFKKIHLEGIFNTYSFHSYFIHSCLFKKIDVNNTYDLVIPLI